MPTDASIPLQVRPFQAPQVPNLIDQYSKIQGIKNVQQETELRRQEGIQNAAKAQREQQQYDQGQRDLDAQKTEGELIAANTQQAPDGTSQINHQAVVQGLAAKGFGQQAATYKTRVQIPDENAQLAHQKEQVANGLQKLGAVSSSLASLSNVDDLHLSESYDREVQDLTSKGLLQSGSVPTSQQLLAQGGLPAMRQFIQQQTAKGISAKDQAEMHIKDIDFGLRQNEFKQKVATEAPQTAQKWSEYGSQLLSSAQTPEQYSAGLKTLLTQGAPTNIVMQFPQQFSPDAVKQVAQMGMKPSERETARHNVVEEAGQAAQRATAAGELAVKQGELGIKTKEYDATYGEGSNPALQGVEPKLRVPAVKEASKAAADFQTAQQAADDMKTFIDLARSGNKVAYSYAPTEGVLTLNSGRGVKRVNMAEIGSYAGAGSDVDKVQQFFMKHATGASIDKSILDNMDQLHSKVMGNVTKAYNDKLSGINQNYRSNFQPVKGATAPSASSIPTPTSQAEYNALPTGAQFLKPNDKTVYTKQ